MRSALFSLLWFAADSAQRSEVQNLSPEFLPPHSAVSLKVSTSLLQVESLSTLLQTLILTVRQTRLRITMETHLWVCLMGVFVMEQQDRATLGE